MATTQSAKKRHRQSLGRRARNRAVRTRLRSAVKKVLTAVAEKGDAASALRGAVKLLDKAAARGVIHRNNASRKAARLARRIHKESAAKKA
ncbi:MAG: 30S ribosomal protein S20 [Candidatus Tectomicrobia bacterium RIFCSPLOWO2_12_FULL_69_37]|nr:MAG: 30S ribosomal protein S20 [Candidatus Tectomicrobia bacterium RIFCSPLOWO2_02_FULL_70_19]OGL62811.1 MAG: 30S ribosomal protein S20 [Candidatus Tectomicrobia bacterium RIFCSPLOWO2_12_FULL_69_37]